MLSALLGQRFIDMIAPPPEQSTPASATENEETVIAKTDDDACFRKGQLVWYAKDTETKVPATVLGVHHDEKPPYFTIKIDGRSRERQTVAEKLTLRNDSEAESLTEKENELVDAFKNLGVSEAPKETLRSHVLEEIKSDQTIAGTPPSNGNKEKSLSKTLEETPPKSSTEEVGGAKVAHTPSRPRTVRSLLMITPSSRLQAASGRRQHDTIDTPRTASAKPPSTPEPFFMSPPPIAKLFSARMTPRQSFCERLEDAGHSKLGKHNSSPFISLGPPGTGNRIKRMPNVIENETIEAEVRDALLDTVACSRDPMSQRKVFTFADQKKMSEKSAAELGKMLRDDPTIIETRNIINQRLPHGATPLHVAAQKGNVTAVRELLASPLGGRRAALKRDLYGRTAFHLAAQSGQKEVVQLLGEAVRGETNISMFHSNGQENHERSSIENTVPSEVKGEKAPLDLLGRTPMGLAALSGITNAENMKPLLFEKGDPSILPQKVLFGRHNGLSYIGASTEDESVPFGYGDLPGWRVDMEDAVCVCTPLAVNTRADRNKTFPAAFTSQFHSEERTAPWGEQSSVAQSDSGLFCVFDGHAGDFSSQYLADKCPHTIIASSTWTDRITKGEQTEESLKALLLECCEHLEAQLKAEPRMCTPEDGSKPLDNSGSTGVLAVVLEHLIAVGNVGDSGAALIQFDKGYTDVNARMVTVEHKPDMLKERQRIENAGHEVKVGENGSARIEYSKPNGDRDRIQMSRAFGDFAFKTTHDLPPEQQAIIAVPDIQVFARPRRGSGTICILFLACDGVWDVMDASAIGCFCKDFFASNPKGVGTETLAQFVDAVLLRCFDLGSTDNMTAIAVSLADDPW